jgi:hypothetical protein
MNLSVYFPAVMTSIITLPLDKVFKAVVPHAAIEYFLKFILLATVNNCWW